MYDTAEKFKKLQNKKTVAVLGIESSCDETAAAVVVNGRKALSNVIASQISVHRRLRRSGAGGRFAQSYYGSDERN